MNSLVRVVLYLRVSTEEQARTGMSLGDQRREGERKARELAAQAGGELQLFVFEDHNGGDILERPVLEDMRTFIRETRPDYFVCLDPNRFSRSLKLQLIVADEIEDQGTRLVFVQQDYDPDDMMSRAFFQFRGLMAELDKAKILDQTLRGKRQKLRSGGIANGIQVFGYEYDATTGRLVVNQEEATWVNLMFQWARNECLGPELIARRLEESLVTTKRGGRWRRCVVAAMLKNTTYIGLMVANRKDARGLDAQRRLPKERRKVKLTAKDRDPSEWIRVQVPAIVPEQLFAEVQALRSTFKRTSQRGTAMLSGLVTCGICGAPMNYQPAKGGYYLLRCVNRYPKERGAKSPTVSCAQKHWRAQPVEEYVWGQLQLWMTDPEYLGQYLEQRKRAPEEPNEAASLVEQELELVGGQIREKKEEQSRILYVVAKGFVHPDVSEAQLKELNGELSRLSEREATLTSRLASMLRVRTTGLQSLKDYLDRIQDQLASTAERVKDRMTKLSPDQKRDLARKLLSSAIIHADGSTELVPVVL